MRVVSFDYIILEIEDGLATLTLNRPAQGNALDAATSAELRRAAVQLSHDPSVRAVLLRADGKVFCGGGDLAGFAAAGPDSLPALVDDMTIDLHAAVARLAKMDAPLVAAVTGAAGGAGIAARRSGLPASGEWLWRQRDRLRPPAGGTALRAAGIAAQPAHCRG